MKYIDADKLITEIEERIQYQQACIKNNYRLHGKAEENIIAEYKTLLRFIKETFLEEQDKAYCKEHCKGYRETGGKCFFDWQCSAIKQREQPVLPGIEETGIPGKDFIPVEWVDACEMYGKWKIVKQEQPEVDLEKELDAWRHEHFRGRRDNKFSGEYLERKSQLDLASHFYELGLKVTNEK